MLEHPDNVKKLFKKDTELKMYKIMRAQTLLYGRETWEQQKY